MMSLLTSHGAWETMGARFFKLSMITSFEMFSFMLVLVTDLDLMSNYVKSTLTRAPRTTIKRRKLAWLGHTPWQPRQDHSIGILEGGLHEWKSRADNSKESACVHFPQCSMSALLTWAADRPEGRHIPPTPSSTTWRSRTRCSDCNSFSRSQEFETKFYVLDVSWLSICSCSFLIFIYIYSIYVYIYIYIYIYLLVQCHISLYVVSDAYFVLVYVNRYMTCRLHRSFVPPGTVEYFEWPEYIFCRGGWLKQINLESIVTIVISHFE